MSYIESEGKLTFDIKCQVFVLKLCLPRPFSQMKIYHPQPGRALYLIICQYIVRPFVHNSIDYIEMHQPVLCSCSVLSQSRSSHPNFSREPNRVEVCLRYWPRHCPFIRRRLAKGTNFPLVAEYLSRSRVGPDSVNCSVEVCDLAL